MAMVYKIFISYLKGVRLTIVSYLPHRDDEDWKLSSFEWIRHMKNKVENGRYERVEVDTILREMGNKQNVTSDINSFSSMPWGTLIVDVLREATDCCSYIS